MFAHGYLGLAELPQEQEVGCSAKASKVPNTTTPTMTTANGPSVFLFVDPHKIRSAKPE